MTHVKANSLKSEIFEFDMPISSLIHVLQFILIDFVDNESLCSSGFLGNGNYPRSGVIFYPRIFPVNFGTILRSMFVRENSRVKYYPRSRVISISQKTR